MLNTEKLEKLLIKNWTEFIDIRAMLDYAKLLAVDLGIDSPQVNRVTLTRFELTENGFLVWIEYSVTTPGKKVNAVSELLLRKNGFSHLKSMIV
jgi:hypothetical protein